ncbi:MAG: glycosyltransferase family 4 protein [Chitinophagaceae bacterium]|nr:glycosyltransferase family 4 protein [Chitinophagaceae bacterium]MCW5905669.1 glycosyltransferase family 4 protein [Chitinophagaceae bacterium]
MSKKHTTWVICSAEGYIKRGYETYTRELVDNLNKDYPNSTLLVRAAVKNNNERNTLNVLNVLKFGGTLNSFLSKRIKKFHPYQSYYLHLSGFITSLFILLFFKRPKIVYVVEGTVYKYLFNYKKYLNKKFKLIYFTGGQLVGTLPVDDSIYLHHVTPCYIDTATKMGFNKEKQFLIPHFTNTQPNIYNNSNVLRKKYGISNSALIVLSVGSIDSIFKRMDYVIEEFTKVEKEKFLILLGHKTDQTLLIEEIANKHLAKEEYLMLTVPKEEIDQYYQLADIVVSASLREGFGLMYVEALANKKVPIVHDFPVSRYVLDSFAIYRNFNKPNELKNAIDNYNELVKEINTENIYPFIKERYAWQKQTTLYYQHLLN